MFVTLILSPPFVPPAGSIDRDTLKTDPGYMIDLAIMLVTLILSDRCIACPLDGSGPVPMPEVTKTICEVYDCDAVICLNSDLRLKQWDGGGTRVDIVFKTFGFLHDVSFVML